jgi:hypothetical protein
MFHTGLDPLTDKPVYVARSDREKGLQKSLLLWHQPTERAKIMEALKELDRMNDANILFGEHVSASGTDRHPAINRSGHSKAPRKAHTKKAR